MRIRIFFQSLLFIFLTQCISAPEVAGQFTEIEFAEMSERMAEGDVDDITVEELRAMEQDIVLLDTRERTEYDISHIPGAIWVGYDDFNLDRVKNIEKAAKIVTYCSVGYRSERVGEQLQKAGYANVSNLQGSIFKWINDGHPVVDKNEISTQKVHGFNATWSKWLKRGEVIH